MQEIVKPVNVWLFLSFTDIFYDVQNIRDFYYKLMLLPLPDMTAECGMCSQVVSGGFEWIGLRPTSCPLPGPIGKIHIIEWVAAVQHYYHYYYYYFSNEMFGGEEEKDGW